MKVFISGPITKGDRENRVKREEARVKFFAAESQLLKRGFATVNPFTLIPPDTQFSWRECMRININALMGCDAIYSLPEWWDSKGAILERHIAEELGLQIIE